VWQTSDLPDYAGMDLMGQPLLERGTIYVAGKTGSSMGMGWGMGGDNQPRQFVLAIRPHDGKVLWKTEVGILREGPRYYYYGMPDNTPQPRLAYRAGSVYLDTHHGVLARLDADSGTLEWGYGYQTDPIQMQGRFIFFFGMQNPNASAAAAPSTPLALGD